MYIKRIQVKTENLIPASFMSTNTQTRPPTRLKHTKNLLNPRTLPLHKKTQCTSRRREENADSGGNSREEGRDGGSGDKIEKEGEMRYHHLGWMWPKSPEIVAIRRNFWSLLLRVWFVILQAFYWRLIIDWSSSSDSILFFFSTYVFLPHRRYI